MENALPVLAQRFPWHPALELLKCLQRCGLNKSPDEISTVGEEPSIVCRWGDFTLAIGCDAIVRYELHGKDGVMASGVIKLDGAVRFVGLCNSRGKTLD